MRLDYRPGRRPTGIGSKQRQDWDRAIAQLDQAIRLEPQLASLYRTRAHFNMEQQDLDAALRDLESAIHAEAGKPSPGLAKDHADRGLLLYRKKDYQGAVAECDAALRVDPANPWGNRLRAHALLKLEQYDKAAGSFDRSLEKDQRLRQRFLTAWTCSFYAHLPGIPWTALFQASPKNPSGLEKREKSLAGDHWARGQIRVRLKNYRGAIDDFTQALVLAPSSPAYTDRGWAYLLSEAPKLALPDFEEAIRLDRDNARAYNGLGFARVKLGSYRQAVQDADQACRLGPKDPLIVYGAARIYAQALGKVEADPREDNRRVLARHYQDRAVSLIREALRLLPAKERRRFWSEKIAADAALFSIRDSTELRELARQYRTATK